ncbi:hypothetical protein OH77DRAFT_95589 [Trametes cingulata]|nr:hypothetical protein OH77DRAFT_95589 [Trametes cingulata]
MPLRATDRPSGRAQIPTRPSMFSCAWKSGSAELVPLPVCRQDMECGAALAHGRKKLSQALEDIATFTHRVAAFACEEGGRGLCRDFLFNLSISALGNGVSYSSVAAGSQEDTLVK